MNWLIYISGWFFGAYASSYYVADHSRNWTVWLTLTMWTMAWVWFCWRFIQ